MNNVMVMGRKPANEEEDTDTSSDRHKPRKMVAIRKQYHKLSEELRKRLGCSDLTELANIAMRELLEKHHLWPPKDAN